MSPENSPSPSSPVKKVVIPVAGRGTRLFSATKAVPKVMLPIGRKPLILYAVEEALASGAESVILVTNRDDSLIRNFFEPDSELEQILSDSGRLDDAAQLRHICTMTSIVTVSQDSPKGLADSIRCAQAAVGNEPFGVILPDAFMVGARPCIGQLIDFYRHHPGVVIATRKLERHETERYGILEVVSETSSFDSPILKVTAMMEKPKPELARSLYGVFGRYILEPGVFDAINAIRSDSSGEIQLTDALSLYCSTHPTYGFLFEGEHFDTGEWLGFAEATVKSFAADPSIGPSFTDFLRTSFWA